MEQQSYLLTTKEAAKFLKVSEAFLAHDRWMGVRIPFVKIGAQAVRYRLSDLQKHIEDNLRK